MKSNNPIPKGDRISFIQKIAISMGGTTEAFSMGLTTNILWMPFFNIGMGISPAVMGMMLMVLQVWNAFMDPVMGNVSDNLRTPWGRRRPMMFVGALLIALLYPFLWRIPVGWGQTASMVYLGIVGILFFTCFSSYAMPFWGLQMELTPNYDERTRVAAWMTCFAQLAWLVNAWALAIVSGKWFVDAATGKTDIVHGVRTCSWAMAGVILVVGLMPVFFTRERYYNSEAKNLPRDPFWKGIGESLRCAPLMKLIGTSFCLVFSGTAVAALGQYVVIYLVFHGNVAQAAVVLGIKGTATMIIGVGLIPVWTKLSERLDKKTIMLVLIGLSVFGHLLNLFCLRPDMPYLVLIPAMFENAGFSAIWLFMPSMKSDVADYDELHTFRRREASLNAFYSWASKAATTFGIGAGGLLIQITGFNAKIAEQPQEVLGWMKILFVGLPVCLWTLSLVFIWVYPLNRARMSEIRMELEARRGAL